MGGCQPLGDLQASVERVEQEGLEAMIAAATTPTLQLALVSLSQPETVDWTENFSVQGASPR